MTALLLAIAAAAVLYVPPLSLAPRLDWALFDSWTRLAPPAAPGELVIVTLNDPAWLTTLATVAEREGARVVLTTLPQPPSPLANTLMLGPTELPLSDRILRRTEWQHGGHLWFRGELDGVVRRDWTHLEDQSPIQSLAAAAARLTESPAVTVDSSDRHWLRFYAPGTFTRLTPADLQTGGTLLRDRVVVAGPHAARFDTPLGPSSVTDLVAQALAGHLTGTAIHSGWLPQAAIWLVALAVAVVLPGLAQQPPGLRLALAGGVPLGILATSGAAFVAMNLALPVTGPAALVLVAGTLVARRPSPTAPTGGAAAPSPVTARRLVAEGRLVEAAHVYRAVPPSVNLLGELYQLAAALEAEQHCEHAAALFHRIAQIDVRYRDVATRLASSTRSDTTAAAGLPDLLANTPARLGRYELLEIIGHGTTGQVYMGRDPKINRLLAIKVINVRTDNASDDAHESGDHLRREVESAGRLNHPNIVTIYDVGEADGLAYIAMEYLRGRHLSDFTDEQALLAVPTVLELLARTADALHYAHEHNVVHRDIKPANIMYDSVLDELKITDFGIARLIDVNRTRTGIILGTPSYMAPEQLEGENVNGHTDLFALGVTLYQLLTGRLPFQGASMTKLMFVIANEPHQPVTVIRPGLPAALSPILDRALAKEPSERFATGAEMADALRAVSASIL